MSADGVIKLFVEVQVDPAEMKNWRPETISSFFAGVAMAEAAREKGRREANAERRCIECGELWPCDATVTRRKDGIPHRLGFQR